MSELMNRKSRSPGTPTRSARSSRLLRCSQLIFGTSAQEWQDAMLSPSAPCDRVSEQTRSLEHQAYRLTASSRLGPSRAGSA